MTKSHSRQVGVGRKPITAAKRLEVVAVRLTEAQRERLKLIGEGNVSKGVRICLERYKGH